MSQFKSTERAFALCLVAAFLFSAGYVALHHEIWRDEMRAWLIARDSGSLVELSQTIKHEGHPLLWYLCLWLLSRITWSPIAMQVFHLLLACASVYVCARFAPFSRLNRVLFAFGYFAFYEYAVVSRNYAIGILLLFVCCALLARGRSSFVWAGLALALAAHASAHLLILASVIAFGIFLGYRSDWGLPQGEGHSRRIWLGLGLVALSVASSAVQLVPARNVNPENLGIVDWLLNGVPLDTVYISPPLETWSSLTQAFLPIPAPVFNYHDSFWLESFSPYHAARPVLATLIFSGCCLLFWRSRLALWVYVAGTIGILSFFMVVYSGAGSHRHVGLLFMVFVVCAWLCSIPGASTAGWNGDGRRSRLGTALTVVLSLQVVAGGLGGWLDIRKPHTQAREVARFIRTTGLQDALIAVDREFSAMSVVGYLQRESFYWPRRERFGSFTLYDPERLDPVSDRQLLERVRLEAVRHSNEALILWNRPLDPGLAALYRLRPLAQFAGSARVMENFWLYGMCLGADGRPADCAAPSAPG